MKFLTSFCALLALAFTIASAASSAAQNQPAPKVPIRQLPTPTATSSDSIGSVAAVRQLPNGSVLVNDQARRAVVLLDATMTVPGLLEGATGGFGMGGRFFRAPWVTAVPSWQLVAIYALPMVFVVGLGMLYASIWLRYKMIGSVALTIALALLGLAVTAVITWQDAWPSVGDGFAALQPLTAMLILGGLGAFAMAASWLTLRHAPV